MDLFDTIRPNAASSAILRPLWDEMITLDGGPHELSRRSGIPSYTIAGYFLGKENVTKEALSTLRSAIAETPSDDTPSIAEVRWFQLSNLVQGEFEGDLSRLAPTIGIEDSHLKAVLLGYKRLSGAQARTIEERLGLESLTLDTTHENRIKASGTELHQVRNANALLHLIARHSSADEVIARCAEVTGGQLLQDLPPVLAAIKPDSIKGMGTRQMIAAHRELIAGIRFGYGVARKLERALHLPDKSLDFFIDTLDDTAPQFGG